MSFLGTVTYEAQDEFLLMRRKLRCPKMNSFLGTVSYGAQDEFLLGRRKLQRPR